MGRRKKEPESVHREAIASAAERLFTERGIQAATMDDIAGEAGYSKATLYVYFANKEELVGYLVLKSMKMLCSRLADAAARPAPAKETYMAICRTLAEYQKQYPFYFSLALGEIHVETENTQVLSAERETYDAGEEINRVLTDFLNAGIASGELKPELPVLQTVFLFWAALSGLIQMAAGKEVYIKKSMGLSTQQFLEDGFENLFHLIAGEEKK